MKTLNALLGMLVGLGLMLCTGCATTARVIATPVAVARDVVDLPLASIASGCKYMADLRGGRPGPVESHSGYGWTSNNGWGPGLGVSADITGPFMRAMQYVFGVPDYLICRSLYPDFPKGVSPWKKFEYFDRESETWGEFLFPNTGALWSETKK